MNQPTDVEIYSRRYKHISERGFRRLKERETAKMTGNFNRCCQRFAECVEGVEDDYKPTIARLHNGMWLSWCKDNQPKFRTIELDTERFYHKYDWEGKTELKRILNEQIELKKES